MWGIVNATGGQVAALRDASTPGGPLHTVPASWVGQGFPVAASVVLGAVLWVALVRILCAVGPASAMPVETTWLWRIPHGSGGAARRQLRNLTALAGIVAGGLGSVIGFTGLAADLWRAAAVAGMTLVCALAGCLAVGLAALLQRRRSGAAQHEPLPGWELRRAGLSARHLRNSVAIGSAAGVGEAVAVWERRSVPAAVRGLVSRIDGPRGAVLVAACAAEHWPRVGLRFLMTAVVTVTLAVGFSDVLMLASWVALAFAGYQGFGTGVAYLRDVRSGVSAERLLPTSGRDNALLRLVLPCCLNAVRLAAVSAFLALATQQPPVPMALLGLLSGIGIGCASVHRVMSPPADRSEPLLETPAGALPMSFIAATFRGGALVATILAGVAVSLSGAPGHGAAAILCLGGTALAMCSALRSSVRATAQSTNS